MRSNVLRFVGSVALCVTVFVVASGAAEAAGGPSGERIVGQSVLEPVFNDVTGAVAYIKTPINAPENANPVARAPFYVPVYPVSSFTSVGTLQCTDAVTALNQPENCPDHGPQIAAAVQASGNPVYASGVLGHDHLLAPPGSGGDFNIAWEPILVVFIDPAAAQHRVTTLAEVNALISSSATSHGPAAVLVPLPQATFHCEVVPAVVYAHGTPV